MKKLFLLLFLVLCTACSNISYNVSFGESIKEDITVVDENHVDDNLNLEEGYMDGMSAFEFFFQTLPYRASSDGKGSYLATKEFKSIDDFINNSFVFDKLLSSDSINFNEKKVKVNISQKNLINSFDIDNLEISIYIPYFVSKHNADNVSNNTYTWVIDDINKDSIKINFDMSKGVDYRNKVLSVITIVILGIVATWIIIYFVKRNKEANEI